MGLGFPAYYAQRWTGLGETAEVRAAARSALMELNWNITHDSSDGITASTGINGASWGEKICIGFPTDGSMTVTSRCAFALQIVDWGRNKNNVDQVMLRISERLERTPVSAGPPLTPAVQTPYAAAAYFAMAGTIGLVLGQWLVGVALLVVAAGILLDQCGRRGKDRAEDGE